MLFPDDWLNWTEGTETPQDLRDIYIRFLEERMKHSETFVNEAQKCKKGTYMNTQSSVSFLK